MTDTIDRLVQARDVDGLRRLFLAQSDNLQRMIQLSEYMTATASSSAWLREQRSKLNDVWFLVFKRLYPIELLAAYEYDYYARYTSDVRSDPRNEAYLVIDYLLGVNFASRNGPMPGVYGKEFFGQLAIDVTTAMSTQWWTGHGEQDGASLNPPRDKPTEWQFLHIKLRRIAFWLIHAVAHSRGNAALDSLMSYAQSLRLQSYPLHHTVLHGKSGDDEDDAHYEQMYQFFVTNDVMIRDGHYSLNEWSQLIHATLLRVNREWSDGLIITSQTRLTDVVLLHFYSLPQVERASLHIEDGEMDDTLIDLPFIYDGSPQAQETFKTLILHAQ